MTKVIFVNGPPQSGKDSVGKILETILPNSKCIEARCTKMAHALKVGTHCLFRAIHGRLTPATLSTALQDDIHEDMKDTPLPLYFGKTPREAYIGVSELLIKPMFGKEFWGLIVADRIMGNPKVDTWIITDSGFKEEAQPIIREVGAENCYLLRMHRRDCDFSNDSRGYLHLHMDVRFREVYNNQSKSHLLIEVRTIMHELGLL